MIKILIRHSNNIFSEVQVAELKGILNITDFQWIPLYLLGNAKAVFVRKGYADGMPYYHEIDGGRVVRK